MSFTERLSAACAEAVLKCPMPPTHYFDPLIKKWVEFPANIRDAVTKQIYQERVSDPINMISNKMTPEKSRLVRKLMFEKAMKDTGIEHFITPQEVMVLKIMGVLFLFLCAYKIKSNL
ncbi:MAG: hypothetical protein ABSA17_05680 [Rhabdochlamydiaceae bacterium]